MGVFGVLLRYMKAIILDGQLKSSLSAVRSLGSKGISVSVGAERETGMALHSKYATATFVYPSPYTDQAGFIRAVKAEAIRVGEKPLVYAFSDATYLSLFEYCDAFTECATLVFPESKSVEIAFDKAATYSLARVSGIPTIPTYAPVTNTEIMERGLLLKYPAVVKARRSVTWKAGVGIFGSASFVMNGTELVDTFVTFKEKLGEAPLVQEMIFGEEYGVEMLASEGRVYAIVTHHRLRSLSPTGGASVLKETLGEGTLKSQLEAYAQKLVEKLLWSGPIMVEFKVDSDTRTPYLMEINGRFWGSLPLSIASGVDMTYLLYRSVMQNEIPKEMVRGRDGVRSTHFLGDVQHLLRVLFKRDSMRKYLYPSRSKAFRDFLLLPPRTKPDVWSFSDPKPSLFEIIDILKKLWK